MWVFAEKKSINVTKQIFRASLSYISTLPIFPVLVVHITIEPKIVCAFASLLHPASELEIQMN